MAPGTLQIRNLHRNRLLPRSSSAHEQTIGNHAVDNIWHIFATYTHTTSKAGRMGGNSGAKEEERCKM